MYSPPVCVSEVDVLLAVAPDALNLPRFLRRVVPVNKTRRHTSYPYRRLKETYQHVPHFSSPSVPPVHKTRVVIHVARTRTEIKINSPMPMNPPILIGTYPDRSHLDVLKF